MSGHHIEVATAGMGTVISVQLAQVSDPEAATAAAHEALAWIPLVEQACSRFREDSEVLAIARSSPGTITVSPLLSEVLALALVLAERTGGAFDPTLGRALHARGFHEAWDSGQVLDLPPSVVAAEPATARPPWERVQVDRLTRTVHTTGPTLLDLGGIAKGFAIDLLMHRLSAFPNRCLNAGGDVRSHGHNADGGPWRIGIRDPSDASRLVAHVDLTDGAVCTSAVGGRSGRGRGEHLMAPDGHGIGPSPLSVSVLASTAVVADGLSTAAFIVGPEAAHDLLCEEGASALFLLPDGQRTVVGADAMAAAWSIS